MLKNVVVDGETSMWSYLTNFTKRNDSWWCALCDVMRYSYRSNRVSQFMTDDKIILAESSVVCISIEERGIL